MTNLVNGNSKATLPDSIKEVINNAYFLEKSNIRDRLNTQLFYVHFELHGSALASFGNTSAMSTILGINAVDMDFPAVTQEVTLQKIFNKNYSSNTQLTMGDMVGVTFVESSDLFITNYFLSIVQANMGAHRKTIKYFPEELFFDIYFVPLIVNKDSANEKITRYNVDINKNFNLYKNCSVKDTTDVDFNQMAEAGVPTVKIMFAVEERYSYNTFTPVDGRELEIQETQAP